MGFLSKGFKKIAGGVLGGGLLGGGMGATIGGLLGGGLGDQLFPGAQTQGGFSPYAVQGPFGSMSYDAANRQINLGFSPQQQFLSNSMYGAMAGGPYGMTPEQSFLGQQGATLGQDALGLGSMSGMFGRGLGQQAAGIGSGFLNAANMTDPSQIAAGQMDRMQALLSPRRERARLGLESRLLRQGLLGSTAGGEQFRGMDEANAMQDAQIAADALGQGQAFQQGLFGMGMQGMQGGQGMFNQGTSQQLGGMATGLGMMGMPVQMQQQALGNFMNLLQGRQSLSEGLLGQAQLGMGAGQNQSQIDAANAAAKTAANNQKSDMFSGLLQGGLMALGGM